MNLDQEPVLISISNFRLVVTSQEIKTLAVAVGNHQTSLLIVHFYIYVITGFQVLQIPSKYQQNPSSRFFFNVLGTESAVSICYKHMYSYFDL